MSGFNVICEDGVIRHPEPFATQREADTFAWWGHVCTARHTIREAPTYVVWYASVGCLPDADEPEFVGTLEACEAYVAEMRAERDADPGYDPLHDLYEWSIDPLES